jgi:hypothetical protein
MEGVGAVVVAKDVRDEEEFLVRRGGRREESDNETVTLEDDKGNGKDTVEEVAPPENVGSAFSWLAALLMLFGIGSFIW